MPSVPYPRQRRGPSRKTRWKNRIQKDRHLSPSVRLFLVATLSEKMSVDGFVSYPRHLLAEAAGVTERQVSRYISSAIDAGWLVTIRHGVRTKTAEYQAVFPDQIAGHQDVTLSACGKPAQNGGKARANSGTSDVTLSAEIAGHQDVPPVVPIQVLGPTDHRRCATSPCVVRTTEPMDEIQHRPSRPPRRGAPMARSAGYLLHPSSRIPAHHLRSAC